MGARRKEGGLPEVTGDALSLTQHHPGHPSTGSMDEKCPVVWQELGKETVSGEMLDTACSPYDELTAWLTAGTEVIFQICPCIGFYTYQVPFWQREMARHL